MGRFLGVLLALITSQGWQWARITQEKGWLAEPWPIVVAIGLTIIFGVQQFSLSWKKLAAKSDVAERSALVDVYLQTLVADYYSIRSEVAGADTAPIVRANVMLPIADFAGLRKRLQICYVGCPEGVSYTSTERDLFWSKKNGLVGWVWSRGISMDITDGSADGKRASESLTVEQRAAVAHLKSALCVPIMNNGKTVGVLTLDGQEGTERTLFSMDRVKDLVVLYAQKLPSQCFENGIARK